MKGLICSVCIFVLLFVTIFVSDGIMKVRVDEISHCCAQMKDDLEQNDKEKAIEDFCTLKEMWYKNRNVLFLILNHTEIDLVDADFEIMEAALIEGNKEICLQNAYLLNFHIDDLLDTETVSPENIF